MSDQVNRMNDAMRQLAVRYFQKILYADLEADRYTVLKSGDEPLELSRLGTDHGCLSEWFRYFVRSPLCHPDDREQLSRFAAPNTLRQLVSESGDRPLHLNYRRKNIASESDWRSITMDILPTEGPEGQPAAWLFVRDNTSLLQNNEINGWVQVPPTAGELFSRQIKHGRRRLLLIEDNELEREMLKALLEDEFDILEAENGAEGLEVLRENFHTLSVILLDLQMPVMDGFTFLEKLKHMVLLASVPVIILSGSENKEDQTRGLSLGAVDFLQKPYNPRLVRQRIHGIIQVRESAAAINVIEFDDLTRLYTREAFFLYAEELLRRNPDRQVDLLLSCVSNYAGIVQQFGEQLALDSLRYIGSALRKYSSQDCLFARLGDDRIVCIVVNNEKVNTESLLQLAPGIAETAPVANLSLKFGVYRDVEHDVPISLLIERAESALNSVRHQYDVHVGWYDSTVILRRRREEEMEANFERALREGEFEVWYQPKYAADTQKIDGAEALIRWRNSEGTLIAPNDFIPLFERDGLIPRLDEYVFRTVCRFQSERRRKGLPMVRISVNLSRASLFRADIIHTYSRICEEEEVDPSLIPIEITESVALRSERLKDFAEGLFRNGFSLHMDDFGSGYSSLASLQILRFDAIKLDKTLVDFCGTPGGDSILRHTIAFAKECGMDVVAEGVENARQREILLAMGCDSIQGYHYSAAVPREMFEKLLRDSFEGRAQVPENLSFSFLGRRHLLDLMNRDLLSDNSIEGILGAVALYAEKNGRVTLTAANQAFLDIFHRTTESLGPQSERDILSLLHPDDRNAFLELFDRAERSGEQGASGEFRFAADRVYWCSVTCYFLRRHDGIREFCADVSERTSFWFTNELLRGVPGGLLIYRADEGERILFSNALLWELFGCDTEEEFMALTGGTFRGLLLPEEKEAVEASIARQIAESPTRMDYVEYRIRRRDGGLVQIADYGHMMHSELYGNLFYVFLTEKKD